jgi:hypothetical protein
MRHGAWRQNFHTAFSKYFWSRRKDAAQKNGHAEISHFGYRLNWVATESTWSRIVGQLRTIRFVCAENATDITAVFRTPSASAQLYLSTKDTVGSEHNLCMYTQGVYFIVSLSTTAETGAVSHRKPEFTRNLEFVFLLLFKLPYCKEKPRNALNSWRMQASCALDFQCSATIWSGHTAL